MENPSLSCQCHEVLLPWSSNGKSSLCWVFSCHPAQQIPSRTTHTTVRANPHKELHGLSVFVSDDLHYVPCHQLTRYPNRAQVMLVNAWLLRLRSSLFSMSLSAGMPYPNKTTWKCSGRRQLRRRGEGSICLRFGKLHDLKRKSEKVLFSIIDCHIPDTLAYGQER